MDIKRTKKVKFYRKKKVILAFAGIVFLSATLLSGTIKLGEYTVETSNIVTAVVRRGDLAVKVSAPGILATQNDQWVSSPVEGKVDQILVRPGASLEEGQLLIRLQNYELVQEVTDLTWELSAMEADVRALEERQKTSRLEMQAQILDHQTQYDKEKLRLDSEKILVESGNSSISSIEYQDRRLTVLQLEQTIAMDKARARQLDQTLSAEFEALTARLNRVKNQFERAKYQLASLEVKAPVAGVLQSLPLDLGERVATGDNIARIANQYDLIAKLRVPEFSAFNISLGQRATIDTRSSKIPGEVMRVDPAVVDGTVQVDVKLIGVLPAEVRPDLSIDGEIFLAEKKDTLYVRRPTYSQQQQKMSVFIVDKMNRYAYQTKVQFGISSSQEIEIESGLNEGDKIIVSEVDEFERFDRVALK